MWRWVTRGLILSTTALLAPLLVAQLNFAGSVDAPDPGLDHSGLVLVQGWALNPHQISKIELWVDDQFQHEMVMYLPRTDVVKAHPDWPGIHNARPGFITGFLASRFPNGPHTVEVRVYGVDGVIHSLGRRTININNTINQSPFGFLESPGPGSIVNVSGAFPVAGWASDTDGIQRVEVMVDGGIVQAAMYGDARPDVAITFPDFPAALHSGFVANLDSTRLQNGVHTITVRAIDKTGMPRIIGTRTVQVINNDNFLRPFGFLESPQRDAVMYGTSCGPEDALPTVWPPIRPAEHLTPIRGWALDLGVREGSGRVTYVELLVDGSRWLSSDDCGVVGGKYSNCYGLPRYDVARYFPTFPDSPRSGFLFTLDVGALMKLGVRPGSHQLSVRVGDNDQTFAELPGSEGVRVWFQCADNGFDFPAVGFIENPTPFDYVGGDVTFWGWALEDQDTIAAIEIIIDGNLVGQAQYGYPRPDVADHYPHIANSLYSGWAFTMDTRKLADSRHRLTVRVIDHQGSGTEIGSVDFHVANGNVQP
ncbi:MAG TPA: Ig-like domain-containing protein [Thermoanaerobaculia bacterium]